MKNIISSSKARFLPGIIAAALFMLSCSPSQDYELLFDEQIAEMSGSVEDSGTKGETAISESETEAEEEKTVSAFRIHCSEEYGNAWPSGNSQKNIPSGNFVVFQGLILFQCDSVSHGLQLYTLDPDTMKVSLFCKDAVCTHDMNSDCVSASCFGNLEVFQGDLYALTMGFVFSKYDEGRFVTCTDGEISGFWHGDDGLFAITADRSLIRLDDSGNVELINDAYAEYWNTNYNGKIYGNSGSAYYVLDLNDDHPEPRNLINTSAAVNDGSLIYFLEDKTLRLCTASQDGELITGLTDRGVMAGSMNFDSDYVYYRYQDKESDEDRTEHVIYRVPKDGSAPPEQVADLPGRILNIYTVPGCDTVFAVCFREADEQAAGIYAVKKDGSDYCRLDIRTDF